MSVTITMNQPILPIGTTFTVTTTSTPGSLLQVNKFAWIHNGASSMMTRLLVINTNSITCIVIESFGVATLLSGDPVEPSLYPTIPLDLLANSLDIDMSTLAPFTSLVQKNSGSFPFSWVPVVIQGANSESITLQSAAGTTIIKNNTKTGCSAANATTIITFIVPFPTGIRTVICTIGVTTASTPVKLTYNVTNKTVNGFSITITNGNGGSTASVDWIAFGY